MDLKLTTVTPPPQVDLKPKITDVSEIVHDGKKSEFRDYEDESNPQHAMVKRTYYNMHANQTVDYVKSKVRVLLKFREIPCHFTLKLLLVAAREVAEVQPHRGHHHGGASHAE